MLSPGSVKNVFNTFFCGFICAICITEGATIGSKFRPTKGEVWPKPQMQMKYGKYYIFEPEKFQFYSPIQTCSLLEEALQRYWRIITREFGPTLQHVHASIRAERSQKRPSEKLPPRPNRRKSQNRKVQVHHHNRTHEPRPHQYAYLSPQVSVALKPRPRENLSHLRVQLSKPCEDMPHLEMDESYELSVGPTDKGEPAAVLDSRSLWGALRGLETFSQLLYQPSLDSDMTWKSCYGDMSERLLEIISSKDDSGSEVKEMTGNKIVHINVTYIRDFPRFRHRGLLLDTSRHFLPTYRILQVLDAMSFNKLNVFHWRIVDDQSFPYQSPRFPRLSELGAFHHKMMVYTVQEIKMIVEHAQARGIRVLPEFDVPGHTRSWGEAFPNLLVKCYEKGKATGSLGPMDPTSEYTYRFLQEFFEEVMDIFPDEYFHFGGDEVDFKCWESNPTIRSYMRQHKLKLRQLQISFTTRILGSVRRRPVLWAEAADGVNLSLDALVQIWQDEGAGQITKLTELGHHVIFSSCWYLGANTWRKMYECEPRGLVPRPELEPFVIGGEACMVGELVDNTNVLTSLFPRTCATAERLWSSLDTIDMTDAAHRLEEHTCRMNRRGIDSQPPNGPGFCL